MYSDACTGQNINFEMALSCFKLVLDPAFQVEVIDHIFMIFGHFYFPNDSDFGALEPQAKGKVIHTSTDWYDIIAHPRRKKSFTIIQMKQEEFLRTEALEKAVSHSRTNESKFPISWL